LGGTRNGHLRLTIEEGVLPNTANSFGSYVDPLAQKDVRQNYKIRNKKNGWHKSQRYI
jgi:hypothetical protein